MVLNKSTASTTTTIYFISYLYLMFAFYLTQNELNVKKHFLPIRIILLSQ